MHLEQLQMHSLCNILFLFAKRWGPQETCIETQNKVLRSRMFVATHQLAQQPLFERMRCCVKFLFENFSLFKKWIYLSPKCLSIIVLFWGKFLQSFMLHASGFWAVNSSVSTPYWWRNPSLVTEGWSYQIFPLPPSIKAAQGKTHLYSWRETMSPLPPRDWFSPLKMEPLSKNPAPLLLC